MATVKKCITSKFKVVERLLSEFVDRLSCELSEEISIIGIVGSVLTKEIKKDIDVVIILNKPHNKTIEGYYANYSKILDIFCELENKMFSRYKIPIAHFPTFRIEDFLKQLLETMQ